MSNQLSCLLDSEVSIQIEKSSCHSQTEMEIWIDFKQGSDSALSYIYGRYANPLFNYGCHITSNTKMVQDCIQDLFIDIIRMRKELADVRYIKSYLFVSLKRKVLRNLKKERKYPTKDINEQNEVGFEIISSPESIMIMEQYTKEQRNLINNTLQKLTKKQRESLLLYFYEGFSYEQVAQMMGMSKVKSARVLIYRALDIMRSSLKRHIYELQ